MRRAPWVSVRVLRATFGTRLVRGSAVVVVALLGATCRSDKGTGPCVANVLAFVASPSNPTAGVPFSVTVQARDNSGNVVTCFTGNVTISLGTNPGGATLSGTTTQPASSGVATFFDLKIDKSGAGYTLSAIASGLTGSATNGFTVVAGAVDHLAFSVQPTGATAATTIAPPVQVTAQDLGGNTVTSFTGNVTVAITSGTGTPGAALTGTTAATVANGHVNSGVATFNDLKINLAGGSYKLTATSGTVTAATSAPFTISVGAVDHLAFSVQPTGTTAATTIAPPVQVTAQDLGGNTVTTFTGNVTVAITAGTGTAGAALSGTTTATVANGRVVNGVATFNDLKIDLAGSNYTLTATSGTVTAATSFTFTITIGTVDHFAFTVQPNGTTGGAIINNAQGGVKVTAQDAANNTVTGFSGSVTVSLVTGPGATGALTGTTIATVANGRLVNGVATFNDLKIDKNGTGYRLLATATGVTAGLSNPFDISVGPLDHLVFTAQPNNAAATVTIAPPVQVTAQDAGNNTVTGFNGNVTVAITAGTGTAGALLSGGASVQVAAASGVAPFGTLSIDKAGNSYTLTATATGATAATSAPFNISIGTATRFAFIVPPSGATAGQNLAPPVQVAAQDAGGNTVPTFAGPVTVAITAGSGTAGALLSGGASVTVAVATSGVATFQGAQALSIDKATANPYTLTASGALTSATSAPFTITVGGLSQFAFTVPPTSTVAGAVINGTGGVQVTAQDAAGNALTSFTGQVTMSLGTNPVGGNLTGTLVKAAVAGVATFSDLNIAKASPGYQLLATSGTANGLSQAFAITAAPGNHLAFTAPPSNTVAGASISSPGGVQVTARDANDNADPTFNGNVTVAITAGTGTAGALLSGGATVIVQALNGVATFPALSINKAGINYSLTATATGLTGVASAAFNIVAGTTSQLVFTAQPAASTVSAVSINSPTGVVVTAQDVLGNTTTFAGNVTMTITGGTGTAGALLSGGASVIVGAVNGVATFTGLNIDKAGNNYTLTASINAGAITRASGLFNITHGPAAQLVFTQQPTTATAGANIAPSVIVTVQDAAANTVLSFTGPVTVQITGGSGTANAHLSGGASVQVPNANQGVATFSGAQALSIDSAGTNYTLTANINAGAITKGSAPFTINAGTATKLAFTVQPGASTVAGQTIPGVTGPSVIVRAQDALGNTNTNPGFSGNVTVAITAGTGTAGALLSGGPTVTVQAQNGVATFPALNIDKAGNNYSLTATATGLTGVASAAFNIVAGTASQLVFTAQPTTTVSAVNINSPTGVVVTAQDVLGNTTTFAGNVTMTITGGTGTAGALLSGGASVIVGAVNGVATFTGLNIDKAGNNYTLTASINAGAITRASGLFNITHGPAAQLVFTQQPTTATAGANIAPSVIVTVQDAAANTVLSFTGPVTVQITGGTGTANAHLSGGASVQVPNATQGVATFTGARALSIDSAGINYTLTANINAGAITKGSALFNITPGAATHLVFTVQPSPTLLGAIITPSVKVQVRDALENTVTGYAANVVIAKEPGSPAGTLNGTTTASIANLHLVNGVATFDDLRITVTTGSYRLRATSGALPFVTSNAFIIN